MSKTEHTILVLEADIILRTEIAEYLRNCGYHVVEAINGDEALLLLEETSGIDIVLAALDTPGATDGFEVARRVRANCPSTHVILAGTPERAVKRASELCEHGPMLLKPYDPQLLHEHIKRLLAIRARARPPEDK